MPYDGNPEIKEQGNGKYLYIRKRVAGKLTSTYVGTAVIFANHYLIAHGMGFLVIPEKEVPEFKKLLVAFYEGKDKDILYSFMKERCWKNF